MKVFSRALIAALLVLLPASFAWSLDGEPKDSGMILWLVPSAHLYDIQSDFEYETDHAGGTDTVDESMRVNQSGGMGIMASYVTASPFFISLEAAHQVYLYRADRDPFDSTGLNQGMQKEKTEVDFRLKNSRVGALVGMYLLKAPTRIFIQAGGDVNFETFTAFGRDLDAMTFNASALAGVDYYVSEHFAVGTGARADYFLGEEFSGEFDKFGDTHDATVTLTRIPLNWFVRFGYVF